MGQGARRCDGPDHERAWRRPDHLSGRPAPRQGLTHARPHADKRKHGAAHANTFSFFPSNEWRTEAEQRADLNKWETVLHSTHTFLGKSLKESVFDVHYNARDSGAPATGAERIPYALVITVRAPRHADLHQQILDAHAVLEALQPAVTLQLDT